MKLFGYSPDTSKSIIDGCILWSDASATGIPHASFGNLMRATCKRRMDGHT